MRPHFEMRQSQPNTGNDQGNINRQILTQLQALNSKMERLIHVLSPRPAEQAPTQDPSAVEKTIAEPSTNEKQMMEQIVSKLEDLEAKANKSKDKKKRSSKVKKNHIT